MMNSFQQIGEARLLAYEGQRQIAAALGRALSRRMLPFLGRLLNRCLPQGTMAPW